MKKRKAKARELAGKVRSFFVTLKYDRTRFCPVCHNFGWSSYDICRYCGYEELYDGITVESFERYKDNYEQIMKSERGMRKVKESIGNTGETVEITVVLDNILETVKDIDEEKIISYRHRVIDSEGRIVIIDDAAAEFAPGEKLEVTVWSHRSNRKELMTFADRKAADDGEEIVG